MKNNKEKFSPLAALGSGAICLSVFGGTMAPLFMGVLFQDDVPVFVPLDQGTEYSVSYTNVVPPPRREVIPEAAPEPILEQPAVEEPVVEELAEVELASPEAEGPATDVAESSPEPNQLADVEPVPESPVEPERFNPDDFIEGINDEEEEPEPELAEIVTDIEEAVVEAEVEDPGCPSDLRVENLGDATWYVHRELVEHYAHRPWQIREIAGTWRSRDESGAAIGFKVRPTECSVLFNAGFESDDIVTSINERVVTSALEGIQAYFALRRDKTFDVRVLRDGEEVELSFVLEETEKEKARMARQERRRLNRERRQERPRRGLFSRDRGEAIVDAHEE